MLLSAGPAAGKTCLMSQLVISTLDGPPGLVPILIKIQHLQRHLLMEEHQGVFGSAVNWVDAYLQCVHGAESDVYRMLRQLMQSRRALLLLDGIDEGGQKRLEIERHVTSVLAPQGHTMLVTSRPAGLNFSLFEANFLQLRLCPLSDVQQEMVIRQRVASKAAANKLLVYTTKKVPPDTETGERITGNPLMLSMVISIFESRKHLGMPTTLSELYGIATSAMLERVDAKERSAAA